MPNPHNSNDGNNDGNDVSEARARFEQERMSRRAALRKLGMTSGIALFGMFAIDDLARLAVKKLAQHQETKAIADSIAHDFKDMGVAFAADTPSSVTPSMNPDPETIGRVCRDHPTAYGPANTSKECADLACQQFYHTSQQQGDCETVAESFA